jgi:IS1 family transposase
MATMEAITEKGTIKTITTHYIDGAFVESHNCEVRDWWKVLVSRGKPCPMFVL